MFCIIVFPPQNACNQIGPLGIEKYEAIIFPIQAFYFGHFECRT